MSSAPSSSEFLIPTSQPVSLLSTNAARIYSQSYPPLLLILFYLCFSTLVVAPIPTLFSSLIPLSLLQISYVVTCLPVFGTSSSSKPPKPRRKRADKGKGQYVAEIIPALLSLLLTLFLAAPLTTILMILFGAPLTTHMEHNLLCGTHIALLAIFPLFYVHGVDKTMWTEIAGVHLPFDEVWGGTIGTILGAWLGAVPIPLDWDRDWQKWPITIVTGAYLGCAAGKVIGKYLVRGNRISFEEKLEQPVPE